MKSKIAGCTHHSSKVISKFRNGGEVGGIGGGSGVDGSGNRGNGGFGGGNSSSQGGGGMGGGGKGGVGGTGVNSTTKTGTTMRNSSPAVKTNKGGVVPTSGKPGVPANMYGAAAPAKRTIGNVFNPDALSKVANFRQAVKGHYGVPLKTPGSHNRKPVSQSAPLNGDYRTSRYSKGGK
jgi:hypothetical protein